MPVDIAITLIWVVLVNMMGTIIKRRERHLYCHLVLYSDMGNRFNAAHCQFFCNTGNSF